MKQTVTSESSWVFTFGRDANGECGRPSSGAEPEAAADEEEPEPTPADPAKALLLSDPRCVRALSDRPNGIVSVGSGFYHSMAVSSAGELYTWGAGSGGQLGRTRSGGGNKAVGVCAAPAVVSGLQARQQHVLRAVGGRNHSFALAAPGLAHQHLHVVRRGLGEVERAIRCEALLDHLRVLSVARLQDLL